MEDAADLLWVVNRERQRETQPERLSASLGRVNKRGSELFRYPVPVPYFLQDSKLTTDFCWSCSPLIDAPSRNYPDFRS